MAKFNKSFSSAKTRSNIKNEDRDLTNYSKTEFKEIIFVETPKKEKDLFRLASKKLLSEEKLQLSGIKRRLDEEMKSNQSSDENQKRKVNKENSLETKKSSLHNAVSVNSGIFADFPTWSHTRIADCQRFDENRVVVDDLNLQSDSDFSSCSSGSLTYRVEKAVKRFTEDLILCERRMRAGVNSNEHSEWYQQRSKLRRKRAKQRQGFVEEQVGYFLIV